jgi:hypothetical protein
MAADLADRRNTRPVTVFFGVRAAADLFHLERRRGAGHQPGASAQCLLRRVRADGLTGPLG